MEVVHSSEHAESVVVSQGEAVDMEMTDMAFMMNLLSTSLYTDPQLAVVRETITNATDAHKSANQTKPIEITVNAKDGLIIKDYGLGIPHDKFNQIFGVFGGSTKRDDVHVTGGFGIGCKAPLSITNSFTVINCHEGVMTVHVISKEASGAFSKPKITPVTSAPTEDSGLTVIIPLDSEAQAKSVGHDAHSVVYRGGLNALINGKQAASLDYSSADYPFVVINTEKQHAIAFARFDKRSIYVKYGDIVYPLPRPTIHSADVFAEEYQDSTDDSIIYAKLYYLAREVLSLNSVLILLAEPNTISMAPSRESLTLSEKTYETLHTLLDNFNTNFNPARITKYAVNIVNGVLAKTVRTNNVGILSSMENVSQLLMNKTIELDGEASPNFTLRNMLLSYGRADASVAIGELRRHPLHSQLKLGNREIVRFLEDTFSKKVIHKSNTSLWRLDREVGNILFKVFKSKVARGLFKTLGRDSFNTIHFGVFSFLLDKTYGTYSPKSLYPLESCTDLSFSSILKWVRREVVLTHVGFTKGVQATKIITEHLKNKWPNDIENEALFNYNLPFVRVPRNARTHKAVKNELIRLGWDVIDVTPAQQLAPRSKTPTKKAPTAFGGYRLLNTQRIRNAIDVRDDINVMYSKAEMTPLPEKAEWAITLPKGLHDTDKAYPLFKYVEGALSKKALQWCFKNKPNTGLIRMRSGKPEPLFDELPSPVDLYLDDLARRVLSYKDGPMFFAAMYTHKLSRSWLEPIGLTKIWGDESTELLSRWFGVKVKPFRVPKEIQEEIQFLLHLGNEVNAFNSYISGETLEVEVGLDMPNIKKLAESVNEVKFENVVNDYKRFTWARKFMYRVFAGTDSWKQIAEALPNGDKHIRALFKQFLTTMENDNE